MAYSTINKPTNYFDVKIHGGTGVQKTLAFDFEVDFFWSKMRNDAYDNSIFDRLTGNNIQLRLNASNATRVAGNTVTFGNSSGITLGSDSGNYGTNKVYIDDGVTPANYVAYGWKAANSSGTSNTDGSVTSTVSADTTSGFSIVTYTGTGSATTVGHGLGEAPGLIFVKCTGTASTNWQVYSKALDADKFLELNSTTAELSQGTYNMFNSTRPTSTVFSIGTHGNTNGSGQEYVAYCFVEKKGFSKFGRFSGQSGEEFVYTGFKPAFVILKRRTTTSDWYVFDNKRNTYNLRNKAIDANTTDVEATYGSGLDFLSNGFVDKGFLADAGNELIYIAFAEQTLVGTNNIPATAV